MNSKNTRFLRSVSVVLILLPVLLLAVGVAFGQEDKYGGGSIVFIKPIRAVVFNHQIHLQKGFICDNCHPEIFSKMREKAEADDNFTMESFRQAKYCGACHNGRQAFSSDTYCTRCHIGVKGYRRLEESELNGKH